MAEINIAKLSDTLYKHGDLFTIAEDNYAYADNTNLPVCSWTNFSGSVVCQWDGPIL